MWLDFNQGDPVQGNLFNIKVASCAIAVMLLYSLPQMWSPTPTNLKL